jgi:N utilization substance protein A
MAKSVAANRTEFSAALTQIAHERNLDPQIVMDSIRLALLAAFKKDYPQEMKPDHVYETQLDPVSGEYRVYELEGESTTEGEITKITPRPNSPKTDVTPPGFGRIAAQTAKQVILQKIREAEKSALVAGYEKRLGSLVNGMVLRFIGSEVIIDIDKTEAVMPASEQVHSENYHLNQRLTFYLDSIRDSIRGREIVVSRSSPELIKELFRREVPEVANGSVELKAIARDPGSRAKIAVYSTQSGIDPVGSCVGQSGVRVKAVIGELNGEKIDVVQYYEDPAKFIASALSPAENLTVTVDEKKHEAVALAPADQLSLAIGRDGQNAKLAGKLTGNFHIDIRPENPVSQPESHDSQPAS